MKHRLTNFQDMHYAEFAEDEVRSIFTARKQAQAACMHAVRADAQIESGFARGH